MTAAAAAGTAARSSRTLSRPRQGAGSQPHHRGARGPGRQRGGGTPGPLSPGTFGDLGCPAWPAGPPRAPWQCLSSEAWWILLEVTADEDPRARPGSTRQPQEGFLRQPGGRGCRPHISALRLQAGPGPQSNSGQSHTRHMLF